MLCKAVSRRVIVLVMFVLAVSFLTSCSQPDEKPQEISPVKAELVLIPGGDFLMGKDEEGDCSPAHAVYIDSFYIDNLTLVISAAQTAAHKIGFFGWRG